ncbi:MAG TPA: hypothetical protein VFW38_12475 [Solirubrobacteraceae bacterium]|nr:hypothetical protein [Solirubrobacteraceae bacterium]
MLLDKLDDQVISALSSAVSDMNDLSGAVRASAQYFLDLSEGEADQLLREAGVTTTTPAGWGRWQDDRRADAMALLIVSQSQEAINRLSLLVSVPTSPAQGELLTSEQQAAIGQQTDNGAGTSKQGVGHPAAGSAHLCRSWARQGHSP